MADALINMFSAFFGNPAMWALVAGGIIVYMGSCHVKPYKVCKKCGRSKESHSTLYPGAFGPCRSCKGVGHHLRFGARLLGKKL